MTSSSWLLDMVPPMWTKTAWSSKSAARESTLRSAIQRHFVFERSRIARSAFVSLGVAGICALAGVAEKREMAASVTTICFMAQSSPFRWIPPSLWAIRHDHGSGELDEHEGGVANQGHTGGAR